ncbi:unnamed protein product, partial [Allacma fusca]
KRLVKKTKPKSDDISELPTEIAPEDDVPKKSPFGVKLKNVHITPDGKKLKKVTKKTPEGDKVVF